MNGKEDKVKKSPKANEKLRDLEVEKKNSERVRGGEANTKQSEKTMK